jgi:hypothetical protein
MPVNFIRKELNTMLMIYMIIRDCLEGEPAIKGWLSFGLSQNVSVNASAFNGGGTNPILSDAVLLKAQQYLPMPNPTDQSLANKDRYRQYLTRAVWYNVTARTLEGMVGQVFLIPPVIKVPSQLDSMLQDCDGEGLTFVQSSKRAVDYVSAHGRAALFIDYPPTEAPVTQAQINTGEIKPMIKCIAPWNVINWRTKVVNGKKILNMVVIREVKDSYDEDGFSVTQAESFRVLTLDDTTGNYTVQVFEAADLANGKQSKVKFEPGQAIVPKDSAGQPFKEIPFTFIGAKNNDSAVDKPPIYDLASLNLAHYRNSADYEESSHMVGQPTPWASGLDENWVKNVLKDNIPLGSRAGIPLPTGATVGLLQASPNQMPQQAMKDKEDEMVALGAKLVTQRRIQRTATEAVVDASSEGSVLTNVADNVSEAYTFAFKMACKFVGADPSSIKVQLNTQFELNRMTPDEISKMVAIWQQGAMPFTEMRETLRKSGVANLPDDEARKQIEADRKAGLIPPAGGKPLNTSGNPDPNVDPAGHAGTAAAAGRP